MGQQQQTQSPNQQQQGQAPTQDYSKAWEEYFKRTGQHAQAAAVAAQSGGNSGGGSGAPAKTEPGATNSPAGAQPDYSAQWAEYDRKLAEYNRANGGVQQ